MKFFNIKLLILIFLASSINAFAVIDVIHLGSFGKGKNWQAKRNDFAIYQLFMPFRYYYQRMLKKEISIQTIDCCYVVRKQFQYGSDIMAYLYSFQDPEEMTSIYLKRAHKYVLRQ